MSSDLNELIYLIEMDAKRIWARDLPHRSQENEKIKRIGADLDT